MKSLSAFMLKKVLLFLALVCVLYVGGFILLHYTGLLDVAKSSARTDTWLYRLFAPLEHRWPW